MLLVLLISWGKVQPFLAFLVASSVAAILLGLPMDKVPGVLEKGIGNILGGLIAIVCIGAMFGKLVANSGAAQKIAMVLMRAFGEKNLTWALMFTGFLVGIPLFYNVGFVLLVPLVFSVVQQTKVPPIYLGIPHVRVAVGDARLPAAAPGAHRHAADVRRRHRHHAVLWLHRRGAGHDLRRPAVRTAVPQRESRIRSRCSWRRCGPRASCRARSTASRARCCRWC